MDIFFKEDLIEIGLNVDNQEEVINHLGGLLFEEGYVDSDFCDAVIEREKEFSTGLPVEPFGVAIPHTDASHVKNSAVAIGVLTRPIPFGVMGGEGKINVEIVFLMAIKDCESQVAMLQSLAEIVQNKNVMQKLRSINDPISASNLLNEEASNLKVIEKE